MVRNSLPAELLPNEDAYFQMMDEAMTRYIREFGHVRATTSTIRGERNNIHDCMTAVAKTMFSYEQQGHRFVIKDSCYRLRPKKLNEKLETTNYPTQGSLDFENQVISQLLLFTDLHIINANIGYVPDPIDPRNSTFWIVQPGPGGWAYQLKRKSGAAEVGPLPATDPNQGERRDRVKTKTTKKRADKKEGE